MNDVSNIIKTIQEMSIHDTICFYIDTNLSNFPKIQDSLNFVLFTKDHSLKFTASLEELQIYFLEVLKDSIFVTGKKLLTWNIKDFYTFILHKTKKPLEIQSNFYDLKIIEKFLFFNVNEKPPTSYVEFLQRLKACISSPNWKKYNELHITYYRELLTKVIPEIENVGVLSHKAGNKLYVYYAIDGENNGRMSSLTIQNSILDPHRLGPEQRVDLLPLSREKHFVNVDFKNQEVVVLAWLSKDQKLIDCLNQYDDFYYNVYELLFEKKPEQASDRNLAKKVFLPTFYGSSAFTISENLKISIEEANLIQNNIKKHFKISWDWIIEQQEKVKLDKTYYDHFGRCRIFKENEEYKVRNFCIQSPAAVICNQKLIILHDNIKEIPFFVRDGYYFYSEKLKIKQNILKFYKNLVQFDDNLKFKVTIKIGRDLDNLKSIK